MAADPLVSVVIACHDGEAFLADALDSVLAQTHTRLQIVAVDDASQDGTPEILEAYAQAEPGRMEVIRRQTNAGPCRARRVGFERATRDFICWLDQDDLWEPTKVKGCFIGSITTVIRRAALATRDLRIRDRDFSFGTTTTAGLDWPSTGLRREFLACWPGTADMPPTRVLGSTAPAT